MRRVAVSLLLLVVAAPVHAAGFFFLHNSASPVTVPGGTSSFFVDDQEPPDQPVVVEAITVADDATVSFPVFTSVPFAADTALEPFVGASVNLSADVEMTECATFSQTVSRVSTSGTVTSLATKSFSSLTVSASPDSGLTGFTDTGLLMPVPVTTVMTGEGVALTVTITNKCGSSRTVWLSYDSQAAESGMRFISRTEVEFKCQATTALSSGKFLQTKAKCILACEKHVLSGSQPASDCVPPFGGATADCISRIATLTTNRETGCLDCPECYSGGDCSADASARLFILESIVDAVSSQVYCDDSSSSDGLNPIEAKCQQRNASTLGKVGADVLKCLTACRKKEFKGRVPAGSCAPPVSDPKTAACLTKVETKAASRIDAACALDSPECYTVWNGSMFASWVSGGAQNLDPSLFCGSPSGAFVD